MEGATQRTKRKHGESSCLGDRTLQTRSRKRIHVLEQDEFVGESTLSPRQSDGPRRDALVVPDEESETLASPAVKPCFGAVKAGNVACEGHSSFVHIRSHFNTSKPIRDSSKENEVQQTPTPNTPRHRDAYSKPTPSTPRHRVTVSGRPAVLNTPRTPATPSLSTKSVYNEARKLFSRNATFGPLIGRHTEREELYGFVSERIAGATGGCLYVSGPPGTGKSALVDEVCSSLRGEQCLRQAYVNCMSIKAAANVFNSVAGELELSDDVFRGDMRETLRNVFLHSHDHISYIVILDEMDQLLNVDLNLLYDIFEWSTQESSKLILIGISNALDLTDRFLPKLKSRNLRPRLLPFLPYSPAEISSVISSRSRSLLSPKSSAAATDFTPFLHPTAIQLISKKVAAQTGDLRKAFDIALRAIDAVESETRASLTQEDSARQCHSGTSPSPVPLAENLNLSSPSSAGSSSPAKMDPARLSQSQLEQLTPETAPRATLAHVVRVTAAAFSNGTVQRLRMLNLQQKAVLCAVAAQEKRSRDSVAIAMPAAPKKRLIAKPSYPTASSNCAHAPTTRQVFEFYRHLCTREDALHALSSTEFRDVVGSLETLSLVSAADGKTGAFINAPVTPTKKGRGGSFAASAADERRISATVGIKDIDSILVGIGSGVLKKILHSD